MGALDDETLASLALLGALFLPPLVVIAIGVRHARATWRVRNRFVEAVATITRSRVDETLPDEDHRSQYRPDVAFRYSAGGRDFDTGTYAHRASVPVRGDPDEIRAIVARYPVGSTHACWYDPQRRDVAYLERGTARDGRGMLIAGVVLLAAIVGLIGALLAISAYG